MPGKGKPFQKGQSGNPAGRKAAYVTLAEQVRVKTGDGLSLIDLAIKVANDPEVDVKHRLVAISLLLDRGFGRPTQPMEIDAKLSGQVDTGPQAMTTAERKSRIESLLQEAGMQLGQIAQANGHAKAPPE